MNTDTRLGQALRNNVHWYDVLCAAHGVPGERHPAYWINHGTVPPYMSNLITLANGAHAAEQRAAIQSLIEIDRKLQFSTKDAFQCLDLTPLGFHVLFQATWMHRAPGLPIREDDRAQLRWSVARSPSELETWEHTWRGTRANRDAQAHPRIFRPSLLDHAEFHFLLGHDGRAPVATAALNRTDDVVGISNVFSDREGLGSLFPGCVRMALSLYPELPLVGYERGAALEDAMAAGFEPVHGLTVWNRVPA